MRIILGSSSPRRKKILGALLGGFTVLHPAVDEKNLVGESAQEYTRRISEKKCTSLLAAHESEPPFCIITCDTIVAIDGMIIGKPENFEDAVRIISILRGRTHCVTSGLTMHYQPRKNAKCVTRTKTETTLVQFKNLTDEEVAMYLNKFDYRDKAGAYAIQEHGAMIVERHHGSLSNIIGFPLRLFFQMAADMNILNEIFY